MLITFDEHADLDTGFGTMRTYVARPAAEGRFPGVVLFSEIFQVTGPIRRTAAWLAGHGYVVSVPEVYHELVDGPGVVLEYDQAGADLGNEYKFAKELASYDADARAAVEHLRGHEACSGAVGTMGICLGGHLALRGALSPDVRAAACFYPTDVHSRTLGAGKSDDTLDRLGELSGEALLIFGRQDPHIPWEGRRAIHSALEEAGVTYEWHEVNGQHAFIRDEGHRYDAALAADCLALVLSLFARALR